MSAIVEGALARGARRATAATTMPATGHFMRPIVLAGLPVDDPASQQEIFGPVLVVHPYRDEEEAVRIANGTAYGLAGAVWSRDRDRARALASRIDAGQVFVNEADYNVEAPFGGWKHSGFGREFGVEGLVEFTGDRRPSLTCTTTRTTTQPRRSNAPAQRRVLAADPGAARHRRALHEVRR